jgi:hypothetical protein
LDFAERKDQFGAEAQEPVLVRRDQPPQALVKHQFEEPVQTFLAIVQTGAEIGEDLVPSAFGGAERFEQFLLTDEIVLLVVARHAGIADRRHALVAEACDLAEVHRPHCANLGSIRRIPKAQRLDLDALNFCGFPYLFPLSLLAA